MCTGVYVPIDHIFKIGNVLIRQGHLQTVTLLVHLGADPSIRDGEGLSCLHLAAQFGHTPIVAYLVAKGLSPNLQDRNGMTPLMLSAFKIPR